MDMENLKNNKLFWVVIGFTIVNLLVMFIGTVVIDKTADRVIQRLKKEYSPSPYGPGLDPDKVDSKVFKEQLESSIPKEDDAVVAVKYWRDKWEEERGVNPEQ